MLEMATRSWAGEFGAGVVTINTPEDSVCDYLAALLYEDVSAPEMPQADDSGVDLKDQARVVENGGRAHNIEPAKVPQEPADRVPVSQDLKVNSDSPTRAPVPTSVPRTTKPSGKAPQNAPEQDVALVDREKLNRLLSSAQPQLLTAPVPTPLKEPTPALIPEPIVEPRAAEQEPNVEVVEQHEAAIDLDWHDNGRPHWAQDRFDVLLFKVYGLTLAVPLIALGQIQPITEELTPLFGQADWFMGLQPTPMGQIKTVNTALFVMPERYDAEFLKTAKYVVSIDGLEWGLAVDSVQQPKSLDPTDVKWRTSRTQRPWLAGTIKAHMCALIDVRNMGALLMAADRNKKG